MELWLQGVYSKINWTTAVSSFAMLLTLLSGNKVGLDASQQASLVVVIGLAFNVLIWILRTWFSPKITPLTPTQVIEKAASNPVVEKIVVSDKAMADAIPTDKVVSK